MTEKISFNEVTKVYGGEVVAVEAFEAAVNDGEFISIVGPSGCGKSTLLYMLGGFLRPTNGQIHVDGDVVTDPGPDRGVVFQDSVLYPWLTVKQNIEWGLKVLGESKKERSERSQEFVDMTGLGGFEDAYPHSLSGGMKRRAAIARILVCNPEVLLMDEPFSALDAQTREIMQKELLEIWNQTGQTCVFITHNIEEALFLSDRILVLSARPGTLKRVVDVTDFGRPRDTAVKQTDLFVEKRQEIWDSIKNEVRIAET